jgi:hypothetical protein
MRLINIYTLQCSEFHEADVPPYFILSHRWEGTEITYKDFVKNRGVGTRGWQKVEELCAFAQIQNEDDALRKSFGGTEIEWVWIDTCRYCTRQEDCCMRVLTVQAALTKGRARSFLKP